MLPVCWEGEELLILGWDAFAWRGVSSDGLWVRRSGSRPCGCCCCCGGRRADDAEQRVEAVVVDVGGPKDEGHGSKDQVLHFLRNLYKQVRLVDGDVRDRDGLTYDEMDRAMCCFHSHSIPIGRGRLGAATAPWTINSMRLGEQRALEWLEGGDCQLMLNYRSQ